MSKENPFSARAFSSHSDRQEPSSPGERSPNQEVLAYFHNMTSGFFSELCQLRSIIAEDDRRAMLPVFTLFPMLRFQTIMGIKKTANKCFLNH
jgi:hypothetical protein